MSKLEKLIKELCPDGVEYKTLGDVTFMERGTSLTQKSAETGKYPVISGGREPAFYCNRFNRSGETITVAGSGAGAGYVQYWNTDIFVCDAFSIKGKDFLSTKYLYYCLTNIQEKIYATKKGSGVPHVHISSIDKFSIPVPPLPVQEEIVRILDTFTELTKELTKELTERRRQYEYYRDALLTFDKLNGGGYSRRVKLGEIAVIMRGGNFQKKDFVESGLPCIHYGQMYTHFGTWADKTLTFVSKDVFEKSRQAHPSDIIMAVTSENVEDVCKCTAWVGSEPVAVSGHTAIIRHNQNAKYLSYFFQSAEFYRQKVKLAHGTKVIEVTPDKLNGIEIPLPPLDVQERLVRVLDNFDSICSDLNIGLPAEIEARKKQYEFYRDSLLTFAESGRIASDNVGGGCRYDLIRIVQYVFGYAPVRLGEIATDIFRGSGIKRDQITEDGIPCVRYGEIYTTYGVWFDKCKSHTELSKISNPKYFEHGDILFAITGESVDDIAKSTAYMGNEKCIAGGDIVVLRHNQNPKFMAYALSTSAAQAQKSKGKIKSKVVHSSIPAICEIEIPLPDLDEQKRIAEILDRFDALCNDISQGIPAEIEARRKQYEHYRDKLLTFSVVSTGSTTL